MAEKQLKKIFSLLVIIFLINIGQAHIAETNTDSSWVIMFYFDGDNDLYYINRNKSN